MESAKACFQVGDKVTVYLKDAVAGMRELPDETFDLAIADPPYGASTSAVWKLDAGHSLPGFGGAWRLSSHTWDALAGADGFEATLCWLKEVKRLVKPTGSIWIHSTYHNSGFINVICQMLGLEIINEIVWFKRNSFPNLSARRLTASHETILWVHTGGPNNRQYRFNYDAVKTAIFPEDRFKEAAKQMRTVWDIPNNKEKEERRFGTHPAQKPMRLVNRVLMVAGTPGGRLLVPFVGSGTELIAGLRYGMACIGYETEPRFYRLAYQRIAHEVLAVGRGQQLQLTGCNVEAG